MAITRDLNKSTEELEGWQWRVVTEYNQVYDRFVALTRFIESNEIMQIEESEVEDLLEQRKIMRAYLSVLDSRIARFA
jgi:hypothetical protein